MKVICPNPKCGAVNDYADSGGLCAQCFEDLHLPSPSPGGRAGPPRAGPECYACSAPATTLCQSCGAFSCVLHLRNIFIEHSNGGGGNELRCERCYSSAMRWKWVQAVILLAAAAALTVVAFNTVRQAGLF